MLVTGSRMASGAVLSNITFFNVKPEATTDIELVMRESKEQVQAVSYTHLDVYKRQTVSRWWPTAIH